MVVLQVTFIYAPSSFAVPSWLHLITVADTEGELYANDVIVISLEAVRPLPSVTSTAIVTLPVCVSKPIVTSLVFDNNDVP